MGRRGPKKTPPEIKLAHGTHRDDRDGKPELQPGDSLTEVPRAPRSLGTVGKKVWKEATGLMVDAGYLTALDLSALELYCRAHDEVATLDEEIANVGTTYTTEKGFVGQMPQVNQRFKWLDIIRRYQLEFWLTPTARAGQQLTKKKNQGIESRKRG